MSLNVTVTKISKKTKNDNYIHTVKTEEGERVILGVKEKVQRTFLIAMREQVPVNSKHELDLNMFDIEVRPFQGTDGQTINMKWLKRKEAK